MAPAAAQNRMVEIGIVEPAEQQGSQGRRRGRRQQQRHVDHRQAVGDDGIDRQPDLRIDARQHGLQPAGHRPVAEAAGDGEALLDLDLAAGAPGS